VPSGFAEVELSLIYSSRVPNKAAAATNNNYRDGRALRKH
jgi:hypothetical protein